ncbi:MAG: hypothetical protein JW965_02380 [Bacteroidales bacterium]|nr:hypothetical protein [Bacteroidales bacterium]
MKNACLFALITYFIIAGSACHETAERNQDSMKNLKTTYSSDREFLKKHAEIVELKKGKSALVIIPSWQGRVMTSTCEGDDGFSFGWINHGLISSGDTLAHMNPYGGEERLWLGPEGGQYALFFKQGDPFEYEYWQTPPEMDTESFTLVDKKDTRAVFTKEFKLTNYSGTEFDFIITRTIHLLGPDEISRIIQADVKGLNTVAYRSENIIENTSTKQWTKDNGLVSIWMLGMFNPSPSAVVVIPVREGDDEKMGPMVNDNYFGSIPGDRLQIKGNIIYFKADGKKRGKIGIPPLRSEGLMASYDPANNALTFLICDTPDGVSDFVNSAWELQDKPYSGDALNSYNDGPLEDGTIMGPFYELETSSPALSLLPGEKYNHSQTTIHFSGPEDRLEIIYRKVMAASLQDITL